MALTSAFVFLQIKWLLASTSILCFASLKLTSPLLGPPPHQTNQHGLRPFCWVSYPGGNPLSKTNKTIEAEAVTQKDVASKSKKVHEAKNTEGRGTHQHRKRTQKTQGFKNDLSLEDFRTCLKVGNLGEEFFLRLGAAEAKKESSRLRDKIA